MLQKFDKTVLIILASVVLLVTSTSSAVAFETTVKTSTGEGITLERDEFRNKMQEQRQTFLNTMKENRQQMLEKFKAQREEFQAKMQILRNERKKTVVEKLDTNIGKINMRRTEHFTEVLNRLEEILNSISEKASTVKSEGKDTSAVDLAVSKAQTAIDEAKSAVLAQAGKEYIIQITTEDNLKTNVGTTVNQLQADLKEVLKKILAAKDAVHAAAKELAKLRSTQ